MKKLVAALAISVAFALPVHAEFKRDARYTDADGDMVADIPTDASQLVDPDTLVFAYTPVEDPAVYADGLGLKLQSSLNMLAWPQVTTIFIVILVTVILAEWVSAAVRKALV